MSSNYFWMVQTIHEVGERCLTRWSKAAHLLMSTGAANRLFTRSKNKHKTVHWNFFPAATFSVQQSQALMVPCCPWTTLRFPAHEAQNKEHAGSCIKEHYTLELSTTHILGGVCVVAK
jgi:hypothetical protein